MGKGYRNRDGRDDSILTKTQKTKKQKKGRRPMPKWIVPTLIAIVAVAVVFAIVFSALINNGVFKRNNILVKSQQQNAYSINQYAAQIMLWYSGWVQGQNAYYNSLTDLVSYSDYNQNTMFSWCWAYASTSQSNLKEAISDSAEWLEEMVALCDWGVKNNIPFTTEDEDTAYETLVSSFKSQAKSYYKYAHEVGFPNEDGTTETFSEDFSSYVDYSSLPYFSGFLRNVFGNGLKSDDFRRAAVILTYASRVKTLKEGEYWSADETEVAAELKENPNLYYSLNYLKYAAGNTALAEKLQGAENEDEFKKLIAVDYIESNYFGEYSKLLANALLKKLKDKTGEALAAALEENGLTASEIAKPVETTTEPEGEGEGEGEPEGEEETAVLTKKQSDWLFNKDRANDDMEVITEEDGSSTLLVVTEVIKDEDGNITAVKAVVENFAPTLTEEELADLINDVCHHLGLPHDHDHEEAASETINGDAEPTEGEDETTEDEGEDETTDGEGEDTTTGGEGDTETTGGEDEVTTTGEGDTETTGETESTIWDDLVEALESGANAKLPSKSTVYYVKAVDLEKEISDFKTGLDEAEDKAAYLQGKGISESLGMEEDKVDEALKAVLFPAEGTVTAGSTLIVDADNGDTKHLVYVTEVKTEGEGEEAKTLVSFYDYSVSKYSDGFRKFLFEGVDEETMTGIPEVGATFVDEDEKTVYIVISALGLGDDVVRGGYISYSNKEDADADLKKLEGLTGIELLNKLAELNSDATTSNAITQSSVSSSDLKAWLFDESRKANDAAVVYYEDENGNIMEGIYLAVFLDRISSGESDARTNIADEKADDFARKLAEDGGYKLSEKAVSKIGSFLFK